MNRIYLQSWTTSGRNCALNNAIVERSNHVARVLIFESGCDTRIDLESAESRSSRDCDRCTVDALCSRGVPAGPWERSPSHRLNVHVCVRDQLSLSHSDTLCFQHFISLPLSLSLLPWVLLPPFTELWSHVHISTPSPMPFFWCTFAHVVRDLTRGRVLARAHDTRGLRNLVYLHQTEKLHTHAENLHEWLYHIRQTDQQSTHMIICLITHCYEMVVIFGSNY